MREKTKYILMSRHQNAGHNHNIKMGNISFENVASFKYVETTVTDHNLIHEEITSRFISGNACYHSVKNLLSSRLLSKSVKIIITIFAVALYGRETWCVTEREHRLEVSAQENIGAEEELNN
jgi:hypothetical protein